MNTNLLEYSIAILVGSTIGILIGNIIGYGLFYLVIKQLDK